MPAMFPNDAGSEQVRSTVLRYVLRRSTNNVDTIFAAAAPGDVNPELVDASKQLQKTHDYVDASEQLQQTHVDASKQLQQTHDYEEQAAAFARMVAAHPGATEISPGVFACSATAENAPELQADGAELQADGAELQADGAVQRNGWTFASDLSPETMADIENLIGAHGLGLKAGSTSLPAPVASNTIKINGWTFSKDISAEKLQEIKGLLGMSGGAEMGTKMAGADSSLDADVHIYSNPNSSDPSRAADADAAFARMMAAHAGAMVIGERPSGRVVPVELTGLAAPEDEEGAEEAFAAMVAANPGAMEIAPGLFACIE